MQRLGISTILVCSNVATATVDSDQTSAEQLRELGDLAEAYDVRVAFEALAWGRFVDDYRRSWRIVERADHPRVGLCLDSFHILSRGHDPAGIEQIPGGEDLLPAVVYKTVEAVELLKVGLTLFFLAVVVVMVVSVSTWREGAVAVVTGFGQIPEGISFVLMLSALGAAGAGGVHNLVLSNWIRDKGYGMGVHVPRLVSPLTGQKEAAGTDLYTFPTNEPNLARWRTWWSRANVEHFVSFFVVCFLTIGLMSLLAYETLYGREGLASNPSFLQIQGQVLAERVGGWLRLLFFAVATVSLWAASLGLLDIVGRVASDFLKRNYLQDSTRWTESKLYFAAVWGEIVLGSIILALGFTQPIALLLVSTCAASIVTLIYSVLLIRLNRRDVPAPIRLRGVRLGAMIFAVAFYGFFAVALLVTQIQDKLL